MYGVKLVEYFVVLVSVSFKVGDVDFKIGKKILYWYDFMVLV